MFFGEDISCVRPVATYTGTNIPPAVTSSGHCSSCAGRSTDPRAEAAQGFEAATGECASRGRRGKTRCMRASLALHASSRRRRTRRRERCERVGQYAPIMTSKASTACPRARRRRPSQARTLKGGAMLGQPGTTRSTPCARCAPRAPSVWAAFLWARRRLRGEVPPTVRGGAERRLLRVPCCRPDERAQMLGGATCDASAPPSASRTARCVRQPGGGGIDLVSLRRDCGRSAMVLAASATASSCAAGGPAPEARAQALREADRAAARRRHSRTAASASPTHKSRPRRRTRADRLEPRA